MTAGLDLAAVTALVIDDRTKGIPGGVAPFALSALGDFGWNVLAEDMPLPVAVVRASRVAANRRFMRDYLAQTGVRLAPHGKTSMAPQLFQQQLDDGCWGLTAATVQQLQVYRRFGVGTVLFANQLVDAASIGFVMAELARDPDFRFLCLVDSAAGVARLAAAVAAQRLARGIEVLLEVGQAGGRTGVRSRDEAARLLDALDSHRRHVRLAGVECFEGAVADDDAAATARRIDALFALFADVAGMAEARGLFAGERVMLTAGGTSHFDIATARLKAIDLGRPSEVVIRSGCYILFDHGLYADEWPLMTARDPVIAGMAGRLQPALEVWAAVQSRPEPDLVILGAGKRDLGFDLGLPRPVAWFRRGAAGPDAVPAGAQVTAINDQHLFLRVPPDWDLSFGDLVGLGVSHPCTTIDKWRLLYLVDDRLTVTGGIATFF